jgi:hypothetical protein
MSTLPAPRRSLFIAALLVATSVAAVPLESVVAQQQSQRQGGQGLFKPPHRGPAIGGTSWTLSDVWGEPEMPMPPTDFGPGFDYSPGGYELNGPPNNSPYPN